MADHDDEPRFLPPDLPPQGPPQGPVPPTPPSGPRRGRGLMIAFSVGVPLLAIVLAVTAVFALYSRVRTASAPRFTPPAGTPQTSRPATTTEPPTPTPSPTHTPTKAVVQGWQPVVHKERGVAYDVPSGWEVQPPDGLVGFESPKPLGMSGAASYGDGFCTESSHIWRAVAGVADMRRSGDLRSVSKSIAEKWSHAYEDPAYGKRAVADAGAMKPVRVAGGARGYQVRYGVTVSGGNACTAPHAVIDVVTVRGKHSNGAFILASDQGVAPDPSDKTLKKIISTVRVYH